jgi:signal transduction histidine kinase
VKTTIEVLLIEDNPGDARLIREMLREDTWGPNAAQFTLTLAGTLHEGMEVVRSRMMPNCENGACDVLLLDLNLPDSFGLETLDHARSQAPDLPIVVLTGFDDQAIGIDAVKRGAQDYLVKGEITGDVLRRALTYAIMRGEAENASRELATLEERQRLARELHDSVTQTLFTANVIAESALRQWENDPEKTHAFVRQIKELTGGALAEMRVLLLELRPSSLAQVGLKLLITQFVQSIQSRRQIEITLQLAEYIELNTDHKIALYRIVQEACNNVIKHALATRLSIGMWSYADHIHLQIADNGRGFAPDQVSPNSLGMSIMHERAHEIGAQLSITTVPGSGTCIDVRYPWNGFTG